MVPHRPTPGNDSLPQSVALACGRAKASAAPTIAAALQPLLALDVGQWPAHGFVSVKERTVRLVLRGLLAGMPVHVKVFRPDRLADRARDLLRGERGAAEADNLRRARALGLPAVEPLAHGMLACDDALRSFVMTRTVVGEPFTFVNANVARRRAVGALLRAVHDRGLAPTDLHQGNLLVAGDDDLHLLDLTSVRHRGDVDLVERARALAFFCQELDGGALDAIAAPLLQGYLDGGTELPVILRHELALATHRWRAGALPAFGRRAQRNCKHTEVPPRRRAVPRWHWFVAGGGADEPMRALCRAFAEAPPVPHKSGRRGAVWLLPHIAVKERDAGAARQLWRSSYWLLFAGVATPAPIALRLHGGRGHVFVRRLAGPSLASELATSALTAADTLAAAHSLGREVGRLHAHGLGNRDLKFENLVRAGAEMAVHMVDLDGVRRRSATDTRGRGADLGRLLAAFDAAGRPGGAATVRTFLRSYLRAHRLLLQQPPLRRLRHAALQRAGEWAEAHRQLATRAAR